MSTKYKNSKDVPISLIVDRLNELSAAVTKGREAQEREFTMRIPAECDRDADIVISQAANIIERLQARVAELEPFINQAPVETGVCMCGEEMYRHSSQPNHTPMDSWDYERDLILRNDADNAEEPTMPDNGPWITKTIIELEERIAELECMVKVFRGCIDTQVLPGQGSRCHKIVYDLVGAPDDGGDV